MSLPRADTASNTTIHTTHLTLHTLYFTLNTSHCSLHQDWDSMEPHNIEPWELAPPILQLRNINRSEKSLFVTFSKISYIVMVTSSIVFFLRITYRTLIWIQGNYTYIIECKRLLKTQSMTIEFIKIITHLKIVIIMKIQVSSKIIFLTSHTNDTIDWVEVLLGKSGIVL